MVSEKEETIPGLKRQDISPEEAEVLNRILQAIRQIKYGYIQVTIQDAQVVQIDCTEKHRLNRK
ncbi:MAG TPA: YezD family protein [Chloroflexia bacterium]|nr:YezD family protein [Chloroflexia bacterium]